MYEKSKKNFQQSSMALILDEFFHNKCSMIEIGAKYKVDPVTLAR
ncbi:hypothetical protein HBN50_11085 [Halobacteriovorax sp. GB3]|nr:hypothetical protein [Halobacteriovorax sp. GB3]MDD0853647.1 hypothetical protein [Halobacteriovorax sp. GB3]